MRRKICSRCFDFIYILTVWKLTFISILLLTGEIYYTYNNVFLLSSIFKIDDITIDTTTAIEKFDIFDDFVPATDEMLGDKLQLCKLAVTYMEKHMICVLKKPQLKPV